jgi:hypothetical protein
METLHDDREMKPRRTFRAISSVLFGWLLAAWVVIGPGVALGQDREATIRVSVAAATAFATAPMAAVVHLSAIDVFFTSRSLPVGYGREATLRGIPAGSYHLTVEAPGFQTADRDVRVRSDATLLLVATLQPTGAGTQAASEIRLQDEARRPSGTEFDEEQLRDLPFGRDIWSLVETGDPFTIVDRIDAGGLDTGDPARVSSHGSSWNQVSLRLGDLEVTDPSHGGMPLLLPDIEAVQAVRVVSALIPADTDGPGPEIRLIPRRPSATWRKTIQLSVAPGAFQSVNSRTVPPIARLNSWTNGHLLVSGQPYRDRLGLLVSTTLMGSRRLEGTDSVTQETRVRSLFAHLVFVPRAGEELRTIAAVQSVMRPFPGRAAFSDREVQERDRFWHMQATWDRQARRGVAWSVTAGFQRARFDLPKNLSLAGGTVERLGDGPVSNLGWPANQIHERWDAGVRAQPAATSLVAHGHNLQIGSTLSSTLASSAPLAQGPIAELVGGIPARLWEFRSGASEMRHHAIEFTAYAEDRVDLGPHLTLAGGVRGQWLRGSANNATNAVVWRTLSPRASLSWRVTQSDALTIFSGFGRYRHHLPLDDLAVGEPGGASGSVYRWNDDNGDRRFQPGERGPLISYIGPCCAGAHLNAIDSRLKAPHTDEFVFGVEGRVSDTLMTRVTWIDRREGDLIGLIDAGLTPADYTVRLMPDQGADFIGPAVLQLPVYNRRPDSFGHDAYVLTNPAGDAALYQGFEVSAVEHVAGRLQLVFGATAYRSKGAGSNRGFRAAENDQGSLGEVFLTPNAQTFARGRLFFDRGYVGKLVASYLAPRDVRLAVVARYQDGQPFARLVLVPDLNQGPDVVMAYPRGGNRFTYTATLDARVEKGVVVGGRRCGVSVEAFNLLNAANEVEENVLTTASFRTPIFVQPPRTLRLGVRIEF